MSSNPTKRQGFRIRDCGYGPDCTKQNCKFWHFGRPKSCEDMELCNSVSCAQPDCDNVHFCSNPNCYGQFKDKCLSLHIMVPKVVVAKKPYSNLSKFVDPSSSETKQQQQSSQQQQQQPHPQPSTKVDDEKEAIATAEKAVKNAQIKHSLLLLKIAEAKKQIENAQLVAQLGELQKQLFSVKSDLSKSEAVKPTDETNKTEVSTRDTSTIDDRLKIDTTIPCCSGLDSWADA
jgi:hypothetical protein